MMKKTTHIFTLMTILLLVTASLTTNTIYGQEQNATITLNPGTSNINPSTNQTVNVSVNTANHQVTSVQIIADVVGDANPDSISITGLNIDGLNKSYEQIQNIDGGKRFAFIYTVPTANDTYSTNNTEVNFLTIQFVSPSSGQQSIAFNTTQTKIEKPDESGGIINVLDTPNNAIYTIQTEVTPTPTQTPTPTPTPLPTHTPTPTPTGTPQEPITVNLLVRMQGIYTQRIIPQPVGVWLNSEEHGYQLEYEVEDVSTDGDGIHMVGITSHDIQPGLHQICVKGKSHLRRCYQDYVQIQPGVNQLDYSQFQEDELLAGDVTGDNIVNHEDIWAILSLFDWFIVPNPLDEETGLPMAIPEDINNDGAITINDFALAIINYQEQGDN